MLNLTTLMAISCFPRHVCIVWLSRGCFVAQGHFFTCLQTQKAAFPVSSWIIKLSTMIGTKGFFSPASTLSYSVAFGCSSLRSSSSWFQKPNTCSKQINPFTTCMTAGQMILGALGKVAFKLLAAQAWGQACFLPTVFLQGTDAVRHLTLFSLVT